MAVFIPSGTHVAARPNISKTATAVGIGAGATAAGVGITAAGAGISAAGLLVATAPISIPAAAAGAAIVGMAQQLQAGGPLVGRIAIGKNAKKKKAVDYEKKYRLKYEACVKKLKKKGKKAYPHKDAPKGLKESCKGEYDKWQTWKKKLKERAPAAAKKIADKHKKVKAALSSNVPPHLVALAASVSKGPKIPLRPTVMRAAIDAAAAGITADSAGTSVDAATAALPAAPPLTATEAIVVADAITQIADEAAAATVAPEEVAAEVAVPEVEEDEEDEEEEKSRTRRKMYMAAGAVAVAGAAAWFFWPRG